MAAIVSDTSKLYLLSSKGKVFALKTGNRLDQLHSAIDIKRLTFAHQPSDVLYGIGSDLKVYVWVSTPDVPIRQVLDLYQNERWTPMRGFSDHLLPTDRYHWSDETGRLQRPKNQIEVPSPHWAWEGENWEIDENFDGQLLGPDGWTYAVDFPATYGPDKNWNSLVRRRRWTRSCRYQSTNRWAEISSVEAAEKKLVFTDITAGGCDLSYPEGVTHLSIWAVSIEGLVYVRTRCSRITAYHGTSWMRIDLPEGVEVSQVSCGSAEGVWAATSTGWALVRSGLSRDCQYGSGWVTVAPPPDIFLTQVTVGPDNVWALGKNGSVWFRQSMKKSSPLGTGWISISNFASICLTISRNGEIFALATEDKELYWRSGVSLEDPHGRAWKKVLAVEKNTQGGLTEKRDDPWICTSATAGFLDPRSSSWDESCEEWKEGIMGQLGQRFIKEMKDFSSLNRAVSRKGWNNSSVLKVWSEKLSSWEECRVELGSDEDDDQESQLTIKGQNIHISIRISDLTAVQLHEDPQGIQELLVYTTFLTRAASPLRFTGSRSDIEQWNGFLTDCYWNQLGVKELAKEDRLWILAPLTGCPSVGHSVALDNLPTTKWLTLTGQFQTIESASGITWALGHDNSVWIWIGCYLGKSGTERGMQTDTRTVEVYENQRWNPIGGFSSSRLPSDRWHWSDECGLAHRPKDSFQLPSGSWRWDTEWLVDYNQTDEEGWRYAIDFPTSYHTEKSFRDCVRRRRWSRVMKLESAAPWLPGPAIKLKSISICASVKSGDIVPVWGITVDGSVVLRDRVTTSSPQGDTWIAVKNPIPFVEISVGPFCVWATASDGTAYVRNGTKTKMDGLYWFQVEKPNTTAGLVRVTVGGGVVWAVGDDGQLYFRKNFSAAFPEGTDWMHVTGGVLRISANMRDELYAVVEPSHRGLPVLARRTGIRYDDKIGSGWEFGIFAKDVSARGLLP